MGKQLRLLDGGRTPVWHLDAKTRRAGQVGIAQARAALAAAQPPEPATKTVRRAG
jgi:hypothetical protein